MRVLFLSSEVAPYSKTGGLGDVAKALPAALAQAGHQVLVVTPRYASIESQELNRLGESIHLRFPFGEERAELLAHMPAAGHAVVFLDHPGFYGRPGLYGDTRGDYPDNHRRFGFFAIGALAAAEVLGFIPDVVHLNDWQTGLAALALKNVTRDSVLGKAKCVFTIHNLAFQGVFPKSVIEDLALPWSAFHPEGYEFHGGVSFLKAGLAFSDGWTTVSETYAREIQTPEHGHALDGFLRAGAGKLEGILNGVDYAEWDPSQDPNLPAPYSSTDFSGKDRCKRVLKERFGLGGSDDSRPLFGMVSRLSDQKGLDLLFQVLPQFLERKADLVLLGSGDPAYESALRALPAQYPGQVGTFVGFDSALSHLVEGGSDFFLMPSRYEPCGLNQMFSLRYGTPPIVRATGGLADTVIDADLEGGNGFRFERYDARALYWAMDRALERYQDPQALNALRRCGMKADFSWDVAAQKYTRLYGRL